MYYVNSQLTAAPAAHKERALIIVYICAKIKTTTLLDNLQIYTKCLIFGFFIQNFGHKES